MNKETECTFPRCDCGNPATCTTVPRADVGSIVEEMAEALKLADAMLRGANMNRNVVERKVRAALDRAEAERRAASARELELLEALLASQRMLNKAMRMLPPGLIDRNSVRQVKRAISSAKVGAAA